MPLHSHFCLNQQHLQPCTVLKLQISCQMADMSSDLGRWSSWWNHRIFWPGTATKFGWWKIRKSHGWKMGCPHFRKNFYKILMCAYSLLLSCYWGVKKKTYKQGEWRPGSFRNCSARPRKKHRIPTPPATQHHFPNQRYSTLQQDGSLDSVFWMILDEFGWPIQQLLKYSPLFACQLLFRNQLCW